MAQAQEGVGETGEQELRAVTILNVRGMDDDRQDETERVDEDVLLASTDFLARIVTARPHLSVVLTDWLSIIPALGYRTRPSASRTSPRSWSWIAFQTPAFFHAVK